MSLSSADIWFAKIVGTPTPMSWSQIYNAGSLFAILALFYKEIPEGEVPILSAIGKDVFSSLEEEYFTLESKGFNEIKEAVEKSLEKIPDSITPSFLVAAIPPGKDNLVYLYNFGRCSALLKRGEKMGILLDNNEQLQSASGMFENNDTLVLQTEDFSQKISSDMLASSVHLPPNDIVDMFSAKIHQDSDGKEAALILTYHTKEAPPVDIAPLTSNEEKISNEPTKEEEQSNYPFPSYELPRQKPSMNMSSVKSALTTIASLLQKMPVKFPRLGLSHSKKITLTIAVVLVFAVITTAFLTISKQQENKRQEEVSKILSEAEKKYNEGSALVTLSRDLAREDFEEARVILEAGKKKFSRNSKEDKQLDNLLSRVKESLSASSDSMSVKAEEVSLLTSPVLSTIVSQSAILATSDTSLVYYLTKNGIFSIDKMGKNKVTRITNTDTWKNAGGLGLFGQNIYVLDKDSDQIYKFVPKDDKFVQSDYLGGETDLSNAQSLSIDSSIWVLFKDGSIKKFTKGKQDSFAVTNLPTPFSNPTRITTSADMTNLYILDNGNGRIVVLNKTGSYLSQYQSEIIKKAQDFEVREKDKVAYILAGGKLYKIPLQ